MSKEDLTMAEFAAKLEAINQSLLARDELDSERRKTDDLRDSRIEKASDDLRARMDRHGLRTTTLETKWEAFFGQFGAFTSAMKTIVIQGKKVDRLTWLVGIGIGVIGTLQFIMLLKR